MRRYRAVFSGLHDDLGWRNVAVADELLAGLQAERPITAIGAGCCARLPHCLRDPRPEGAAAAGEALQARFPTDLIPRSGTDGVLNIERLTTRSRA